jgi:uncharacterized protein with von Willebrand factor type A (vWA) domain
MKTILAVLLCFVAAAITSAATPTDEIEGLLTYIKGLDQATFIRNGTPYSPVQAEAHLRMKWNNAKGHVKTAEDFIELCASKSSMSGKSYLIRFGDGRTVEASVALKEQLENLRKPSPSGS